MRGVREDENANCSLGDLNSWAIVDGTSPSFRLRPRWKRIFCREGKEGLGRQRPHTQHPCDTRQTHFKRQFRGRRRQRSAQNGSQTARGGLTRGPRPRGGPGGARGARNWTYFLSWVSDMMLVIRLASRKGMIGRLPFLNLQRMPNLARDFLYS